MAIEIERKFLLAGDDWRALVTRSTPMQQGYLGGDACSLRVRIADGAAWLNIKSRQPGVQRSEFEYAIPLADAQALLALASGAPITKVRHEVPWQGQLFEIDEFDGDNAGLVVAELELPAVDTPIQRPPWLGREVTDDIRYYNLSLVRDPYARWRDTTC